MQETFKTFTEEERDELYLIPVWIAILIAGADNKIDSAEIKKAIKAVNIKKQKSNPLIAEYYEGTAKKFEVNLKGYIALMPTDKNKRIVFLKKKLERVNYFFSNLNLDFASQLYLSYRDLANKIARASGGIFGLLSVSYAESNFVDLKMIIDPSKKTNPEAK